ncbi:flavin-containing monooxygenase [Mesobacillus jeotgali]|uniref:flavin-containing monooxygenase n=1 Tax=Mesobacillus jeotgali TaxID=129985 RepID=UPI00177D53F9|nr:NAD(P)/FAD-dependent oxidoreductase [Mesobacillus jeotgali]UYZ23916.1 NAD(P)/FAD-dependent oxidoreductase [Mesobacillus jeotgali]
MKPINKARIIIIGSGFAGIAAAVRLKQAGENDFIILERGEDVGGVWRDNRYPGCACDVESHLYSLSFAPNPNWSHKFSSQPEIYAYLQDCAKKFDLISHVRFRHEVKRMEWNEDTCEWYVATSQGDFNAQMVVGAFGALSNPAIPKLKGLDTFAGEAFHSSNWPKNFEPKGKRIAVIGTGASAIQFIPALQPEVDYMTVFQRTPAWVVGRPDQKISPTKQKLYSKFPLLQKATRLGIYIRRELLGIAFRNPKYMKIVAKAALSNMYRSIKDPVLREKLTPDYIIGCKRILQSNVYYPAMAAPNVNVVTSEVVEVTEDSIIAADGTEAKVDSIIFGTGFQITDIPFARYIFGKNGQRLADVWAGSPKAYLGTTVSGFPNLFIMQGPNTGLGHTSVIYMIEAQIKQMMGVLKHMQKNQLDIIEPSMDAQKGFVENTEKSMKGTVWTSGGCKSWYLDHTGRNSTLWPGSTYSFRRLASRVITGNYVGDQASAKMKYLLNNQSGSPDR